MPWQHDDTLLRAALDAGLHKHPASQRRDSVIGQSVRVGDLRDDVHHSVQRVDRLLRAQNVAKPLRSPFAGPGA